MNNMFQFEIQKSSRTNIEIYLQWKPPLACCQWLLHKVKLVVVSEETAITARYTLITRMVVLMVTMMVFLVKLWEK